jgi:ABC-type Fe3+/spermidine/putrescine transport system ATPase subunit
LEDLHEGEIILNGKKVLGPAWNLMPGNPDMKLVTQEYYVLENHSVAENVHDKLQGLKDEAKEKRTTKILKLLELLPLKDTRAKFLSSGQRQRVAIARALAVIPSVLLLDEPFSNLDKVLAEKLFSFIAKEVKKHKTSVILITHIAEEALKHADSIAVIHEGKVIQKGAKWQVYYRPRNSRLAGLLGDYNILSGEDFYSGSAFSGKKRLFLRPDRLLPVSKDKADLHVHVTSCTFNGKCYEALCETRSGRTAIVYSPKILDSEKDYYFQVSA